MSVEWLPWEAGILSERVERMMLRPLAQAPHLGRT